MELSREHRESLAALYHVWGLERVRDELTRAERDEFLPPEITEFACAWVTEQERTLRRRKWLVAAATFASVILIGAMIGAAVIYWPWGSS